MRYLLVLILLAVSATAHFNAAEAADIVVIPSEGTAARSDDMARMKRSALDGALVNAVRDAVNSILVKESLVAPEAVLKDMTSSPGAYVLNYRIRSEGLVMHMDALPAGGPLPVDASPGAGVEFYHVWIDASVDRDALRDAITKYLAVSAYQSPLVINIIDVVDYGTFNGLLSSIRKIAVIKHLSYRSFSPGRVTLLAETGASARMLAARIANEVPEKFAVVEGAGQIIIRPSEGLSLE
ncbi:MAG: hypothetical protein QY316_12715 [Thermodesulfobacteriota bacterium]|nr:MAG: hypothetical protein QY316_12715 [Thermodesulfobacteriota bacterium]